QYFEPTRRSRLVTRTGLMKATEGNHGRPNAEPIPTFRQFELPSFYGNAHDEHRHEDSEAAGGRQADTDEDSEKRFHNDGLAVAERPFPGTDSTAGRQARGYAPVREKLRVELS